MAMVQPLLGSELRWGTFGNVGCAHEGRRRYACVRPLTRCVIEKQVKLKAPILLEKSLAINPKLKELRKQLEADATDIHKTYDAAELSVTLCDDKYIQQLNKKNAVVLNAMQEERPFLMRGNVVISVETAARKAEERGHSLLYEMRMLLIQVLCEEDQNKLCIEKEGQIIFNRLGWKISDRLPKQKKVTTKVLFCDMDGTLLNSSSQITAKTLEALRAAMEIGVRVVVATGKTRSAAMTSFRAVGEDRILSTSSPGVFQQGLLVYGEGGSLLYKAILPADYCAEAFEYSVKHRIPVIGYFDDMAVAPFDHPFVDHMHDHFFEPKANILKSVDDFKACKIQRLLFSEKQERIEKIMRPYWESVTKGEGKLTQSLPNMLEMLPKDGSKGGGVKRLIDEWGISAEHVMAIGDGENDIEMLQMAGWGVAMGNGASKTIDIADAIVSTNDCDGVAEAIHKFILCDNN